MRLIDADELKNILTVAEYPCVLQNSLIEIIDMQPTAYNVDNVLEQLEELTMEECTLHECGIRSEYCKSCIAKKAIEIVKAGGKDGNG